MAYLEHEVSGELQQITLDPKPIAYVVDGGDRLSLTAANAADALAAFYRSKRHFVLLSLGRAAVFVNQCRVSVIKIIREGDILTLGTNTLTFRELVKEHLSNDAELLRAPGQCLVDGDRFKPGDDIVYCPECRTPYHERCWLYQKGRCARQLCTYQAPWDEPEQRTA